MANPAGLPEPVPQLDLAIDPIQVQPPPEIAAMNQALNRISAHSETLRQMSNASLRVCKTLINWTALEPMRKRNSMKGQHDALEYPPALIIAAPLPLTKYEAGGLSAADYLQCLSRLGHTAGGVPATLEARRDMFYGFMGIY